jgi:hypothetical protein
LCRRGRLAGQRLHRRQLNEEKRHHPHERDHDQGWAEANPASALELEDAFELALVRVAVVVEVPARERRALGSP